MTRTMDDIFETFPKEQQERINAEVEKEIEEYRKAGLLEDLDKEK